MWYSPGGTRQQYVLEEAEAYSQPLSGLGVVGTAKRRPGFTHYVPPPPEDKYGIPKGLSREEARIYGAKMAAQRQQAVLASQEAKRIPEVQAQRQAMEQARLARQAAARSAPLNPLVKRYTSPGEEATLQANLRYSMTREAQAARQQAALQAAYPPPSEPRQVVALIKDPSYWQSLLRSAGQAGQEAVAGEQLVAQSSDGYAPQDGGGYTAQRVAQEAEAARQAFYGENYMGFFGVTAEAYAASPYMQQQLQRLRETERPVPQARVVEGWQDPRMQELERQGKFRMFARTREQAEEQRASQKAVQERKQEQARYKRMKAQLTSPEGRAWAQTQGGQEWGAGEAGKAWQQKFAGEQIAKSADAERAVSAATMREVERLRRAQEAQMRSPWAAAFSSTRAAQQAAAATRKATQALW